MHASSAIPIATGKQTVQKWGNSLAVRITGEVAEVAGFVQGLPLTTEVVDGGVMLRPAGTMRMSLAQMLKAFDATRHL